MPYTVRDIARAAKRATSTVRYHARKLGLDQQRTPAGYRIFCDDQAAKLIAAMPDRSKPM